MINCLHNTPRVCIPFGEARDLRGGLSVSLSLTEYGNSVTGRSPLVQTRNGSSNLSASRAMKLMNSLSTLYLHSDRPFRIPRICSQFLFRRIGRTKKKENELSSSSVCRVWKTSRASICGDKMNTNKKPALGTWLMAAMSVLWVHWHLTKICGKARKNCISELS